MRQSASAQVVDFFCGAGGTSAGFAAAGLNVVLGIDNDTDSELTFRHNFPHAGFINRDIRKVRPYELDAFLVNRRKLPLVFSACAPCQPFSKQNRNQVRRITRNHQASLLDEFHRFVRHFRPDYIFLENVPGLQQISTRTGPFSRFLRLLTNLNYYFDFGKVKALDFGVPQRRERLILLASTCGSISLPLPTHGPGTNNNRYSTVRDWIGDLPPVAAGETHRSVSNHQARMLSEKNLRRIKATPEGGGRENWPRALQLPCHRDHYGHSDVYGRLWFDRTAPAMTTKCTTLSNGRFGHPTQHRALTTREAACLQTFPRTFVFFGNLASMASQIGNAVPVLLSKAIGNRIVGHVRSTRRQRQKADANHA